MSDKREKFESIAEVPPLELVVNEVSYPFINKEDWDKWQNDVNEVKEYCKNNLGRTELSEDEKTELYEKGQELWKNSFGKEGTFNDIKFNLVINRREYNLLVDLLNNKLEYDVNTLFFAMELFTNMANLLDNANSGIFKDDYTPKTFGITQTDMTLLYTLLSHHKVTGLGRKTVNFANIIRRIGDISKVINHMTNENTNLSEAIQKTVMTWDEGVVLEQPNISSEG